jgi:hypothetical protein
MEAAAEPFASTPIRIRLPDLPSIGEEELSQAFVRRFVAALHSSRERADEQMAHAVEEEATFVARELLVNGVLGEREGIEEPLALLGALYRLLGCEASGWLEAPFRGLLRVEDCPVRRALSLTGLGCPRFCERMREGALAALDGPASADRFDGNPGCVIAVRLGENGR